MSTPSKTRRTRTFMAVNPFTIWLDLSVQASEMMMASAQVIAHRTSQMMTAGLTPSAEDSTEFALMSSEKTEAAMESFMAMANNMFAFSPLAIAQSLRQMSVVQSDLMQLALSTNPAQAMSRGLKLNKSLTRAGNGASSLSGRAAKMASDGLKPIHSRAVANAKRLAKV
jgi:hypothetical protein